jgi:hypothetical protein
VALLVAAFALLAMPAAAHAAFPGENGKIVFWRTVSGTGPCLYTINSDGSGEQALVPCGSVDNRGTMPRWSADGQWVAYTAPYSLENAVKADGTGQIVDFYDSGGLIYGFGFGPDSGLSPYAAAYWIFESGGADHGGIDVICPGPGCGGTGGPGEFHSPDWSPDGQQIAFTRYYAGYRVEVMQRDGSGRTTLVDPSQGDGFDPSWSPDGHRIAFATDRDGNDEIYVMQSDGTGQTRITNNPARDSQPRWSPDGKKLLFESDRGGQPGVYVMDADGSNQTPVVTDGSDPDWQPILRGYPRPKGATPIYASLVPAYQACSAPNRVHAPPLSFGSCAPATQASTHLTVGTPDANGQPAVANGFVKLKAFSCPACAGPGPNADVFITVSLTDVRNQGDLSDYTGKLSADAALRITDRRNAPDPNGAGPGTVSDTHFPVTVPCAATSDTAVGSTCSVATSANAVAPGTVVAGARSVWELGAVRVYDGAGQLFEVQGVFAP